MVVTHLVIPPSSVGRQGTTDVDQPKDATLPRDVTVDRRDVGQVYYSFDDAAWRAIPREGQMSLEDTEDGAVRAPWSPAGAG